MFHWDYHIAIQWPYSEHLGSPLVISCCLCFMSLFLRNWGILWSLPCGATYLFSIAPWLILKSLKIVIYKSSTCSGSGCRYIALALSNNCQHKISAGLDLQSTSEAGNACMDSFISITTDFKLWNKVGLCWNDTSWAPFSCLKYKLVVSFSRFFFFFLPICPLLGVFSVLHQKSETSHDCLF